MYTRRLHERRFFLFIKHICAYFKHKVVWASITFENGKNFVVKRLLWRRGILSRPITHVSLVAFSLCVAIIALTFGKIGVFATSSAQARQSLVTKLAAPVDAQEAGMVQAEVTTTTDFSEKPRDHIIEHTIASGETISQIAEKYKIDTNTIRWANNLSDGDIVKPGQKLKILPVSGVAHEVANGDTIYTIADKYKANPQAIVDLYSNYIGEDFKVQTGQTVIVPDGVPPAKLAPAKPAPRYIAQAQPKAVVPGNDDRNDDQKVSQGPLGFIWPVGGQISQYFTGYHTGLDIAGPIGTPVVAANGGKVVEAAKLGVGYGWHVIVDHGNGYQTMYAHLSRIDVKVGDTVGQGETVGLRGSTGRSTGPHLHFEVRRSGGFQNPLAFLK